MTHYAWLAIDKTGRRVHGHANAHDENDLEGRLNRMRLDLIVARRLKRKNTARLPHNELIELCFQLELLLSAGIPLIEGLTDLRDGATSHQQRDVLADVIEYLHGGKPLSTALAAHPSIFDEVFRGLVQVGESSGQLAEVFGQLHAHLEWRASLAAQTKKLAAYPIFLALIVAGVVAFICIYLAPKLVSFMRTLGQETPLSLRFLTGLSDILAHIWPLLIVIPIFATLLIRYLLRQHEWACHHRDALLFSLPIFGDILRKLALTRFTSAFAMMYAAGMSITSTLGIAKNVSGNLLVRDAIKRAAEDLDSGQSLTQAFRHTGLFPPLAIRMLNIGESTGSLDIALTNASRVFNREAQDAIQRLQTLLEPMLTLIVGALLGGVMLSVLGPLYDLIARLKP
ncbi:MAG TPA: type II secretion system F family protein [Rhodocyclaceae bacterium]|jgi:type IV pilus assembly protein PilC|nr:type II secretion system F family protein [Rhodocyclaceae bacterium]